MPALIPTRFVGSLIWLGRVSDPKASIRSESLTQAMLGFDGIAGEAHGGATRPACSRVAALHPRDTPIRNSRQLSIVGAEDLAEIAASMGLAALEPTWLGASMVIAGLPDFSHLPPSSRLQAPSGATLVVDMENRPCQFPSREIEKDWPGKGKLFKPAAMGKRGFTAWVEREGAINLGDPLALFIPDQPIWQLLDSARNG